MSPGGQVAVSIRQFSFFFPKIYNSMAANTFEGTITINLRFLYELFPFFFFFFVFQMHSSVSDSCSMYINMYICNLRIILTYVHVSMYINTLEELHVEKISLPKANSLCP